jgi:hypothetical protein
MSNIIATYIEIETKPKTESKIETENQLILSGDINQTGDFPLLMSVPLVNYESVHRKNFVSLIPYTICAKTKKEQGKAAYRVSSISDAYVAAELLRERLTGAGHSLENRIENTENITIDKELSDEAKIYAKQAVDTYRASVELANKPQSKVN